MQSHLPPISQWKDRHAGETCLIIGTGPSLNETDLAGANLCWFGTNTFFRHPLARRCRYFCVIDPFIWNRYGQEILRVGVPTFVASENYDHLHVTEHPNAFNVLRKPVPSIESSNWGSLNDGVCVGTSVVHMSLEVAYFLGFQRVLLVGCDCNYTDDGKHHFDGSTVDNFWRRDWEPLFEAYERIHRIYRNQGREIVNCTVGGKLEVFPRASLIDIQATS